MTDPTVLASGLAMGESPRWHDDRLWVCDWVTGEVLTFDDDGNRKVVWTVPWLPFSIDWLPDGRLVVTSGSGRQVWREEPDGSLTPYGGLDRMWNEVVVDGRGNTFVNEIGFDMMAGAPPAAGTVAVVRSDGAMREVADDLWFPNGMAITPDDTTLIVAESYGNRLTAFDIGPDGDLGGRRVWAGLGDAAPDGICLDAEGAVWFADVPHRRCVRVREGGEVLQAVDVDRGCFACMLGGDDGRTLFIVATTWDQSAMSVAGGRTGQILRIRVDVPHAGRP
ncbi:SMP-30/gluconolactonase/LRE family protein [Nocardioides sp. WL0053]|uniref:SMP-30/gluconolactonase/LRE family protein n=1 Tax=Nocardioides jiangsuensis TaxID=2866161 RepID=A0ABS7RP05_9ACTN|nr:SMP-30/gluconolactonase/LRE family protein [Nocardioides jiangsuensis]MBY9076784.1 SMP-30/gluconolactonase/LRE family protein [Nocardioides jiangsuensis]